MNISKIAGTAANSAIDVVKNKAPQLKKVALNCKPDQVILSNKAPKTNFAQKIISKVQKAFDNFIQKQTEHMTKVLEKAVNNGSIKL